MFGIIGFGSQGYQLVEVLKTRLEARAELPSVVYHAFQTKEEAEEKPGSHLIDLIEAETITAFWSPRPEEADSLAVDEVTAGLLVEWAEKRSLYLDRFLRRLQVSLDPKLEIARVAFDLFLVVDLTSPLGLAAPRFVEDLLAHWQDYPSIGRANRQLTVCLLQCQQTSPYAFPALAQMRQIQKEALQAGVPMPIHLYLLEPTSDGGGDPADLMAMLRTWLELVILGYHTPPPSERGVGSFGLVRRALPMEPFLRYLEASLLGACLDELTRETRVSITFSVPDLVRPVRLPAGRIPWVGAGGLLGQAVQGNEAQVQVLQPGERIYPDQPEYGAERLQSRMERVRREGFPLLQQFLGDEANRLRDAYRGEFVQKIRRVLVEGGFPGTQAWIGGVRKRLQTQSQEAEGQIKALQERAQPPVSAPTILEEVFFFLGVGLILTALFNLFILRPLLGGLPPLWPVWAGLWLPFFSLPVVLGLVTVIRRLREGEAIKGSLYSYISGTWWGLLGGLLHAVVFFLLWYSLLGDRLSEVSWLVGFFALWVVALPVLWFLWPALRLNELGVVLTPTFTSTSLQEAQQKAQKAERDIPAALLLGRWLLFLFLVFWIILAVGLAFYQGGPKHELLQSLLQALNPAWNALLTTQSLSRAMVEGGLTFANALLAWLWQSLTLALLLSMKYPAEGFLALWRRETSERSRPSARSSLRQALVFALLATAMALFFWHQWPVLPSSLESLRRWALGVVWAWAVFYFFWNHWNDVARVKTLLGEWVDWFERKVRLELYQFAWQEAQEILRPLSEAADDMSQRMDALQARLPDWQGQVQEEKEEARREAEQPPGFSTGFLLATDQWEGWVRPYLLAIQQALQKTRSWFVDLLDKGVDLNVLRRQVRQYLLEAKVRESLGKGFNLLEHIAGPGAQPTQERGWAEALTREALPFPNWARLFEQGSWPRWRHRRPRPNRSYLGLPLRAQESIAFQRAVGFIFGIDPTVFTEAPWAISAIRYQTDAIPDPAKGDRDYPDLEKYRRQAEETRRRWQESAQGQSGGS